MDKLDTESNYIYQRYDGVIRKYEVRKNILIDTNTADVIDLKKQALLGKVSENILDLLEIGDVIMHGVNNICTYKSIFEDKITLDYFLDLYKDSPEFIQSVVTHEHLEKGKTNL